MMAGGGVLGEPDKGIGGAGLQCVGIVQWLRQRLVQLPRI